MLRAVSGYSVNNTRLYTKLRLGGAEAESVSCLLMCIAIAIVK